jgi:hypothetical protein
MIGCDHDRKTPSKIQCLSDQIGISDHISGIGVSPEMRHAKPGAGTNTSEYWAFVFFLMSFLHRRWAAMVFSIARVKYRM